jgi:hypothetical protein
MHRDGRHHSRGHDPDLALVARQRRPRRAARDRRHGGEAEVGRRDAHAGGHPDPGAADHGGLDQQKADHPDLHGDGKPRDESGEERCARVHARLLSAAHRGNASVARETLR